MLCYYILYVRTSQVGRKNTLACYTNLLQERIPDKWVWCNPPSAHRRGSGRGGHAIDLRKLVLGEDGPNQAEKRLLLVTKIFYKSVFLTGGSGERRWFALGAIRARLPRAVRRGPASGEADPDGASAKFIGQVRQHFQRSMPQSGPGSGCPACPDKKNLVSPS